MGSVQEAVRSLLPRDVKSTVRLLKFLGVGGVGAIVDNGILIISVEIAGLTPVIGAFLSKETSITTMFIINQRWTFKESRPEGRRDYLWRYIKSNGVRWVGAGIGIATLYVLNSMFGIWYVAANIIGIGVGFIANYIFESLFTFKIHTQEAE